MEKSSLWPNLRENPKESGGRGKGSKGGRLGSDSVGLGLVMELVRGRGRLGTVPPGTAPSKAACADEKLANEG